MHTKNKVADHEVDAERKGEADLGGGEGHKSEVTAGVEAGVVRLKECVELFTLLEECTNR